MATTSFQSLRPKAVAITAGTQTETIRNLEFLPFGGRTRADFPPYNGASNVVLSTRAYNLRGQVTEIDVTAPTGTILDRSLTYDYTAGSPGPNDPGPNLDRIVDHRDASQSRFYFYEDLDRLASAKTLAGAVVESDLYDGVGNRTQKTTSAGTTTYSYEIGTDRLTQATGPEAKRYAHDAYGSRIYTGSAPYAGSPSLLYNDENRLMQAKDADASFAVLGTYTYDAFGRRVKKVAGGKTELFFYDLAGHTIEMLEVKSGTDRVRDLVFVEDEPMAFVDQDLEVGTALGPVAFEFDGRLPAIPVGVALGAIAGLALLSIPAIRRRPKSAVAVITLAAVAGGVSVARSQGGGATFHWIHTDHLGTPLAATNTPATPTQATAVWRAVYAPFGEATVDEDSDGDVNLVAFSLRFPGQLADSETGLHDNYFRQYEPSSGRFLQPDLVGLVGGVNLYAYARSAPTMFLDPLGLDVIYERGYISNPAVRSALEEVDRAFPDADVVVTGGDRYRDADGAIRETLTGQRVRESATDSPHLNALAVDFYLKPMPDLPHSRLRTLLLNLGFYPGYLEFYANRDGSLHHIHGDIRHLGAPECMLVGVTSRECRNEAPLCPR